jgi:hypothetical protein
MSQKLYKLEDCLGFLQAQLMTETGPTEVTGCYVSDLLSDVLARAHPGVLWLTVQTHRNVVSVAATKDLAAVLFTCGRKPDPAIVVEAEEQGIVLLTTPLSMYEAAGKLWEAGLR